MTKLVLSACLLVPTIAFSGVMEKKAIRQMQENTNAVLKKTQAACGNTSVALDFDLKAYEAFYKNNEKKISADKGKEVFLYVYAERNASAVLDALSEICADADYKAEVAKLKTILIQPNAAYDEHSSSFALDEKGLKLTAKLITNPRTRNAADFVSDIKKVW